MILVSVGYFQRPRFYNEMCVKLIQVKNVLSSVKKRKLNTYNRAVTHVNTYSYLRILSSVYTDEICNVYGIDLFLSGGGSHVSTGCGGGVGIGDLAYLC